MALSSTQIGAIGENLLINAVMKASDGRLTPFQPLADDDGLDVLFFDKETGNSVAIQLKCRTATIRKRGSDERGNVAHFQVRQATFSDARRAYLVAALCNADLTGFIATWFMPMELLPELGRDISGNWVMRPSKAEGSLDRFTPYRCMNSEELAQRIIAVCERQPDDYEMCPRPTPGQL
jgi:hypothetical protein